MNSKRRQGLRAALALAMAGIASAAGAAAARNSMRLVGQPGVTQQPESYFTNLVDGASIVTPYVLRFGLARAGLAAGPAKNAGHHHLLIDRDLPLDFSKPLPFNRHYMHFGGGEMETVFTARPGTYRLRLLLADHRHIPLFVYSKPLNVTVTAHRDDISEASLTPAAAMLLSPVNGQHVRAPFRVQFHAAGFGISPLALAQSGLGHFRLIVESGSSGAATERLSFDEGQTEAWLAPPTGNYKLTLELVDNASPNKVLAKSAGVGVKVE
jgi:hypothetical protein